ncbi:MAG: hypothetical protein KDK91_25575 [Gammaproteobacteria bacterium]|nr:hypothetical protein [Gammaproteobacteria bacterium]
MGRLETLLARGPKVVTLCGVLMACLLFSPGVAQAQARRSDGGDQALKRAQYMLRSLTEEKAALEAQLGRLQAEQVEKDKALASLQAQNDALTARLEQFGAVNQQMVQRIQADAERYRQLAERFRQAVVMIKQANRDNAFLVEAVKEREAWIEGCVSRSRELVSVNNELLQRYLQEGFDNSDSILGLKRVQIENTAQDFRFRIEDLEGEAFQGQTDVQSHVRVPDQGVPADSAASGRDGNGTSGAVPAQGPSATETATSK